MLASWVRASRRLLAKFRPFWRRVSPLPPAPASPAAEFQPLERIVLTDEVSNTLFDQYAEHRTSMRGDEETGWILMGRRGSREALALASLPAGMGREAGVAHVRFNSSAQAVAGRILRQDDRQLSILGVVHTHPGSLRHPSDGDFDGDSEWVRQLRGGEGVFGIDTVDSAENGVDGAQVAQRPKPHVQSYRGLRFSWYALGVGDQDYRPLDVELTIGPDLARPLHLVWTTLEQHADRLENLFRRLRQVRLDALETKAGFALQLQTPIGETASLRAILCGERVQYFLVKKDQWLAAELQEPAVDCGVFLMLAELAKGNE